MGEVPIIGSHTHDVGAGFGGPGERLVLFHIGPSRGELSCYAFTPEQAREVAQRLLDMANVAENLEDPRQN
jgi:hypothetical protein